MFLMDPGQVKFHRDCQGVKYHSITPWEGSGGHLREFLGWSLPCTVVQKNKYSYYHKKIVIVDHTSLCRNQRLLDFAASEKLNSLTTLGTSLLPLKGADLLPFQNLCGSNSLLETPKLHSGNPYLGQQKALLVFGFSIIIGFGLSLIGSQALPILGILDSSGNDQRMHLPFLFLRGSCMNVSCCWNSNNRKNHHHFSILECFFIENLLCSFFFQILAVIIIWGCQG